jgi:hypothetical protein
MGGNLADDQESRVCFSNDPDCFDDAFSRRHPSDGDEKLLRLIVERNFPHIDSIINHRQGLISEHSGLRPADANREAVREVIPTIFVKLSFNISIGDQRGVCEKEEKYGARVGQWA